MKNLIICLITAFTISTSIFAQKPTTFYEKEWRKVEKFELKSLPKSALDIVDDIYLKAKKDNNAAQITKALIYKSKFALTLEEDAQLKIVNTFKTEISTAKFPTKNILENVLANLYWQYYKQNRYKIFRRTKTDSKVDDKDFRTWDLQTIFNEIHFQFQNSLSNGLLSQLEDLNDFNAILKTQEGSKKYRPTLYDFLSYNALDFYKTKETSLTNPSYKFEIDNPDYLDDYKTFSKLQIQSKDSISLQYNALLIYQNLINFHENKHTAALISADLDRINFVRKNAIFKNRDSLQLKALTNLKNQYSTNEASTLIDFKIAEIYNNLGKTYISNTKPNNQFKRVEALKICNNAIQSFPESMGAKQCKKLKENILASSLQIKLENNIPIQQKSKLLVTYKNIDTLSFLIYSISEKEIRKFNTMYLDSFKNDFINKLTLISTFKNGLKTENDYQKHTTEIAIPALNNGNYLIVAKPNNRKTVYATTLFQATDILIVDKSTSNNHIFQVLDRNTGEPLSNAKVEIKNYNTGRYNKAINKNLITNNLGEIAFTTNNYHRNVVVSVFYNNEKASFDNYYFYENSRRIRGKNNKSETVIKPFIFTDRSIYRPGQTIYFKAIFLKEHDEKTEVFINEHVEIVLEDPNGQDVKQLDLKLNEFGSASGSFIIPNNGLTGEYTILVDESYKHDSDFFDFQDFYFSNDEFQISVEEYKRPKFEAEFKPVTETYKINDSIKIDGNAIAFAGSNISDAKVSYRVHRKVQLPRWYYWHQPRLNYSPQEITNGETTTDAQGNFEITFKAIPDNSVAKENTPVFTYEIEADITDINGETRSVTTLVKVGYHSLEASVNISNKIDIHKKESKITLNTTNLNGEFTPSKGTIKIYKLVAPKNVLRKRVWNTPDYQLYPKEEYETYFPHEPYSNDENEVKNWKNGTLVFQNNFDTEKSKEVILNKFKKWELGKYIIELNTQDKFNQPVSDKQIFTVYNPNSNLISDNQLFDISTDKNSYAPLENIKLKIGSASAKMFVTIAVEKNHKIINTQIIELNNEYKSVEIPVTNADYDGFAIHYSFANYNYFKSGTVSISVPKKQKNIAIETLTFRDKLQPGQKETWSFKIKGDNKEKITAEILASMYDVSLDQFKSHNWQFNPFQQSSYYSYNNWNASKSIGTKNFDVYNLNNSYANYSTQKYDALNWFGFSFNNNRYANRQYLRSIKPPVVNKESFDKTKKEGFVYGTIYDSEEQPLPGVNVTVKGKNTGVVTDFDGKFSIEVKKGKTLILSFLGFETSEVKISKNNVYSIVLIEDSSSLDEVVVVVVGYGSQKRKISGAVAGVEMKSDALNESVVIRGTGSIDANSTPLYIVDGVPYSDYSMLDANDIASIDVLKDASATAIYGARAANGVIIISTKKGQQKLEQELQQVKTRTNFNETAFFYPKLKTDEEGNFSFSFTMPEALTKWKLQLLAHTKEAIYASKTLTTVTQKDLMVLPNPPRFLREGDEIVFSSKISNLTKNTLNGVAKLILTDAISGKEINTQLGNTLATKNFLLDAKGNTNVSWTLNIPKGIQAVQYKIVAKAGDFSDGEQQVLPVLSNRMLVTETLPMWVRSNQTKTFTLDKLKNTSTPHSAGYSTTLSNHKLTLEITSNPAWYAIQSLPYLMEYPYECAEQMFSRFYANTLASHIANSNPRIQEVFNLWKTSDALISNLEKNQELKSIIIQETPWLRDAQSETEQKKRIAMLFDLNTMNNEQQKTLNKLEQMQLSNGGFPWFKGSNYPNRYITQHIAASYGHLKQLQIDFEESDAPKMIKKAVNFLDYEIIDDYDKLLKQAKKLKEKAKTKQLGLKAEADYLAKKHIGHTQLQYLYMRNFYEDISIPKNTQIAIDYYTKQSATYWTDFNLYSKGLIALIHFRNNNKTISTAILKSLKETSITNDELGMYWKENTASWYWYQAPIETQALLIEAFSEIENDIATVDELKIWLLKNKQTNSWKTTKETTEAVYALLLQGSDWLSVNETVDVTIGGEKIEPSKLENVKVEAGTGYYKTSWNANEITPEMAVITISKKDNGIAWGSLYWQYFEDLDKITSAETPLKLSKKLFLKSNSDTGKKLTEISENTNLELGDLITVRIELKVDRAMEFIHMKDMRASGLEPINVISSYKWQDGLGYYESTKDASTNFFMDNLPKGVYVFEYDLRVNNAGNFSNGITTIQSMYAPEFSSHSEGVRINVEE